MTDTLQPLDSDPLTIAKRPYSVQPSSSTRNSENLIQNHKRLSLLAQIYNFQPVGCVIKFHLPIINTDNSPLFMMRISPSWMPLTVFSGLEPTGSGRIARYCNQKGWVIPTNMVVDEPGTINGGNMDFVPIGKAVTIIEYDDPPDIAFWNLNCLGWRGSINYQLRCISNVTTQGKLAVSRLYDISSPPYVYDPSLHRTPLPFPRSQVWRRKNAQMLLDLSRADDFEINCPYISKQNYNPNYPRNDIEIVTTGPMESYLCFDILDTLSASAGAAEFTFEIWIQAGPDFEYVFPFPPTTQHFKGSSYIANGNPHTTIAFGQDTNLTVTLPDTYDIKS